MEDYVGDHSIKKENAISNAIAINKAIEIVMGDQVCTRDRLGVNHDKKS